MTHLQILVHSLAHIVNEYLLSILFGSDYSWDPCQTLPSLPPESLSPWIEPLLGDVYHTLSYLIGL